MQCSAIQRVACDPAGDDDRGYAAWFSVTGSTGHSQLAGSSKVMRRTDSRAQVGGGEDERKTRESRGSCLLAGLLRWKDERLALFSRWPGKQPRKQRMVDPAAYSFLMRLLLKPLPVPWPRWKDVRSAGAVPTFLASWHPLLSVLIVMASAKHVQFALGPALVQSRTGSWSATLLPLLVCLVLSLCDPWISIGYSACAFAQLISRRPVHWFACAGVLTVLAASAARLFFSLPTLPTLEPSMHPFYYVLTQWWADRFLLSAAHTLIALLLPAAFAWKFSRRQRRLSFRAQLAVVLGVTFACRSDASAQHLLLHSCLLAVLPETDLRQRAIDHLRFKPVLTIWPAALCLVVYPSFLWLWTIEEVANSNYLFYAACVHNLFYILTVTEIATAVLLASQDRKSE